VKNVSPAVEDVDTRTDVYSLGVVLYALLTGSLPFDSARWKQKPFHELLRQLREEDPPRPSTKISGDRDTQKATAELRQIEPHQLVNLLRGDLDWITMKAVEKDRALRYGTPSELAADIQRYLHHEPVTARPASTAYRVRKYIRRHRVGVGVAAGFLIVLMAFAINQSIQLRRITRERDRANRIADFMSGMFRVSNPSEARGNTITAREILDKSSKDIDTGLSKDPELQAQMMDLMGRVYEHLGLYSTAQGLLSRAVEIRRRVLGPEDPDTLLSMNNLANSLSDQDKFEEGDKFYQQVIEAARRTRGRAQRTMVMAMNNFALNLIDEGHVPEAEKMQREVVESDSRTLGPEHPDTLTATSNIAITMRRQGHYADAEKTDRQVLEGRRRALGPDHPDTLRSVANLALDLQFEQGHDAEGEQLLRPALDAQKRILGPAHPDTLESMNILAVLIGQEGKLAEQEAILRDLVDTERRSFGPEHSNTLRSINNLGTALEDEGKYAEATEQFRTVFEIQRRLRGPDHYYTLVAMSNLAGVLQNEKKYAEAEKLGREALNIERRKLGDENAVTLAQMDNLATTLEQLGRASEAEKLLQEAKEHQAHVFGPDSLQTARSAYKLAAWAALRGERDKALSLLSQAIDHGLDHAGERLEKDADLKSLRGDPRFAALIEKVRQRVTAQANKPLAGNH